MRVKNHIFQIYCNVWCIRAGSYMKISDQKGALIYQALIYQKGARPVLSEKAKVPRIIKAKSWLRNMATLQLCKATVIMC